MTDNTNADIDTRAHWVKVAKEFNVPIRCVRFTASTRLAEHNDAVRALNPDTVCTIPSFPTFKNSFGHMDLANAIWFLYIASKNHIYSC